MNAIEFRKRIEDEGKIKAAARVNPACECIEQADAIILAYVQSLLQVNKMAAAGVLLWGENLFNPRPGVVRAVWGAINRNNKVLVQGGGAVSKSFTGMAWNVLNWWKDPEYTTVKLISTTGGHARCFGKGTMIRMHDGTTKPVEEIRRGDFVMGPDSTPRRVLSTHEGEDDLYYVRPHRTPGFVCNGSHILHLEQTFDQPERWLKLGEVRHVSVSEYLKKSGSFRERHKMARQGFELPKQEQLFDPYIVGLWLGDGNSNAPALTTMDPPLRDRWNSYFSGLGYVVREYRKRNNRAATYYARFAGRGGEGYREKCGRGKRPNAFHAFTQSECKDAAGKRIPKRILLSSTEDRLACLAGLIDTDGSQNQKGYILSTALPGLKDDILNLCASLGFHAYAHPFTSSSGVGESKKLHGTNWSIRIRGRCDLVPVLLERKKCAKTETNQRPVGFTVGEMGRGKFYGFSVDGDHLFLLANGLIAHNSNTFSTIKMFFEKAIVPMPGVLTAEALSFTEGDKRGCFSIIRIREGEDNSGVLQGFHPLPRQTPHPVFGPSSRVVAVLDEAEEIPLGVWTGVENMLTSIDDTGCVKIMAFYNPKDISAKTAQNAEPPGGWGEFDIETGYRGKDEWTSREGWHVVRLDPKKTENVRERKVIYPGLQTYVGYRGLETKNGGNSLPYFTFGRGAYPPDGAVSTIVTQRILANMRGDLVFVGSTVKVGAADVAIDGRDEAVFAAGRTGRAVGIRRANGEFFRFPEERQAAQLDQLFTLPKGSTSIVAAAIKRNCLKLGIAPEWMMLDRTGNGAPVHDLLCVPEYWHPDVKGIDFSKPATEVKILQEDSETPAEQYEGVHSEVWFALARWGEFGYVAISPSARVDELERQLIGRRYVQGAGKKLRVEKKDDYKKRIGRSPDHADAFTIFVHCARVGGSVTASMTGRAPKEEDLGPELGHGVVDQVEWMHDGV